MPASDEYIDALLDRHGLGPRPPLPNEDEGIEEFMRKSDAMHRWWMQYNKIVEDDFERNPDAHEGDLYGGGGVKSTYPDGFGGSHATKRERDTAHDAKWLTLVGKYPICALMKEWMWERPGTAQEKRWARALAAFGVNTHVHEPMSIHEARDYANRGWKRWTPVVKAMKERLNG